MEEPESNKKDKRFTFVPLRLQRLDLRHEKKEKNFDEKRPIART